MANYVAVSKETHQDQRWTPNTDFTFAATDALCPIAMQEAPTAVLHLPIAFCKLEEHFQLFAVQSLEVGRNYLVDSEGRWLAGYIPAAYRGYPFALVNTDDNKQVLCIDTDSGLLSETQGNDFFDEKSEPTKETQETLDFLTQLVSLRQATLSMCLLLEELDLLEPWQITVESNGEKIPSEGLFRVNEAKLNALSDKALGELRDKGALPLIYSQLISTQNMPRIAQLSGN